MGLLLFHSILIYIIPSCPQISRSKHLVKPAIQAKMMKSLLVISLCAASSAFVPRQQSSCVTPRSATSEESSSFSLRYSPMGTTERSEDDYPSRQATSLDMMKRKSALKVSSMMEPEEISLSTLKIPFQRSNSTIPFPSFVAASSPVVGVTEQKITKISWDPHGMVDTVMKSYLGPRLLLAAVACLYGTNFPLGSIMDQALPASAATSSRMLLAALALSPFITQLPRELMGMSLLAGCFTASGYVSQSMALVDTSPATVSFLGAATVIWCPFLEWLIHRTPMGWRDRPQTWISAAMCMLGVGVLELGGAMTGGGAGETSAMHIGMGDGLAILQAMGFGTGLFLSEQMMKKDPSKALPITAVMVATSALVSMVWALSDGWIGNTPGWESMTLPNMLIDPSMQQVAMAVVWTGLLSTSLNFFLEVFALGSVPSGEASVILASEPLWAAAFASILLGEEFGWNDYTGGFLIVAACVVNSMQLDDVKKYFSFGDDANLGESR